MVLYARLLYPDGIVQFQQDYHPAHIYILIRDWFVRRLNIELIDWPHCSLDLNPIPLQGILMFVEARPGCLGCRDCE